MTAGSLLNDLQTRSVRLVATADKLTVDAPHGALTPGLREAVRTHKTELIRLLTPCCPLCHAQAGQREVWRYECQTHDHDTGAEHIETDSRHSPRNALRGLWRGFGNDLHFDTDALAIVEELAAIAEHDGGLSRFEAECYAINEWLASRGTQS